MKPSSNGKTPMSTLEPDKIVENTNSNVTQAFEN